MSLAFPHTEFLLPPSTLCKRAPLPSRHHHHHPAWKRRRLKPFTLYNHFNPSSLPFENLFHSILSQFPTVNNLNYIAPTVGLASGLALYFSSKSPKFLPNPKDSSNYNSDIGEWILFSSPTPFNRFVILRCPSIYFPGSELLENVSEKLVKEDRHYVNLNCGRIVQGNSEDEIDGKMVYQRVCVGTEDGGVLSLDWPANLDLEGERGLDTTVLIVPGTAEGSNERNIREFVCECLRRGVFPVVMNPRGCAGSPLTTARLFTAADSDDISAAVRFIHKKRPWTTFMGVGWGYGANMLTKYLAECGERTPLTAATCIGNPFDLEEATRSSLYHMSFDQRLTRGLINILQCNKELFQGQGKGFDVEKALSASSIRDFEKAISMVSYGFDTIEVFYEKSSTRDVVGKVKIPVLFIQNDDGTVPLFSIPRGSIAENPYTSLLLCSYSPSCRDSELIFSWCLNLTIEWLTSVELGLLKGRHPLLKDVDVTINPSNGLALVDGRASSKSDSKDKLLNLMNGYSAKHSPSKIQLKSARDIGRLPPETEGLQEEDNSVGCQTNAVDAEVQEEEVAKSFHNERGQVLQTAQMVMNMLDVTMPDTLSEEQKKKVLNAVGQGEMLLKAMQDAVPEDVREKLTGSVVGIVQSQGSNLKFDELLRLGHIPDVVSGLNSKLQEKIRLSRASGDEEFHSSDQNKRSNDSGDGSGEVGHGLDKLPEYMELGNQSSENLEKSDEIGSIQSTRSHWSNNPDSEIDDLKDVENKFENEQFSRYTSSKNSDDRENVPEISANREFSNQYEGPDGTEDISSHPKNVERECVKGQSDLMEENNNHNDDFSTDQSKVTEVYRSEDKSSAPSSSSETQLMENEAENNQNKEEKDSQPVSSQNNAAPPSFSVSQALDALTGFDDSTQVSVNSVFHVIEGMIDQLEVKKDENEMKDANNILDVKRRDKVKNLREGSAHLKDHDHKSENMDILRSNPSIPSVSSNDLFHPEGSDENYKLYNTYDGQHYDSSLTSKANRQIGTTKNFAKYLNNLSGKVPGCLTTFPYGDLLYKEYLKAYLLSEKRNAKRLDLDTKSALYLDYFPEDGQWKLLEQREDNFSSGEEFTTCDGYRDEQIDANSRYKFTNNIIEPSYVILDSGEQKQNEEFEGMNMADDNIVFDENKLDESMHFVKNIILECLNAEVGRRVSAADMEELELKVARDIEHVANAVSLAARHGNEHVSEKNDYLSEKLGSLQGENIVRAISFAVQDTPYLREVLPVGVIVGSTLAALRKFNVSSLDSNGKKKDVALYQVGKLKKSLIPVDKNEINERLSKKIEDESVFCPSISKDEDKIVFQGSNNNKIMVGAVTAALGASALLAHQQNTETDGTLTELLKGEENSKEPTKLEEMPEKTQNYLITSLAEKAMSVASPVMPMKEDGEVDHERLVSMLAELGQKGGLLKLVGKVALLWGGIRGAMSLTDKLISFLQIADRPLFQRILAFVFMVLLLWSPIIVPLFPSLMQSWATQNPFKVVELTCIAGLYVSIMIMVMLWGKRIRKYDDPLVQYGLDLTSIPKFQNFLKGFAGGAVLVLLINSVNSSLGCVQLCWPTTLSSSHSEPVTLMKSYAWMLLLIVQGIATATGIATVEELLFRSWLPQEIAVDFGYHRGIIISGLAFSLSQRSIWEIPGLWLLSLCLSGAQQRSQGSLSLPVGLRTGILACNFILKMGGFLTYQPSYPLWITGGHPFQPFSGVVGLAFSLALAIIMYPRQPLYRTKITRAIRK